MYLMLDQSLLLNRQVFFFSYYASYSFYVSEIFTDTVITNIIVCIMNALDCIFLTFYTDSKCIYTGRER